MDDKERIEITEPTGGVTAEERQRLISEAAYYRAERRGFMEGFELQDWLEAEAEFDAARTQVSAKSAQA
jgi:hypothetical protein